MASKIKIKQLTSGNELSGKVIKSDGLSGFDFLDVIEKGITFPISPLSGDTFYRTDVDTLFHYDGSRSKWLSVNTSTLTCGRSTSDKDASAYMLIGDSVQSSTEGFVLSRNGTIISASIDNSVTLTSTRDTEIRINNSIVNKATLSLTSGNKSLLLDNINQDFSSGDRLQVIVLSNTTDTLSNVIVIVEVAWRI